MNTKYGDLVFIDTNYRPAAGSFAKPRELKDGRYKVSHWFRCREIFHGQLYNLGLFFFAHPCKKGHHIAAFMRKVEDMLDVTPRSNFGPTQRKTIMWIAPSKWWTIRAMRRSLFTILLRVSVAYNPKIDNFWDALYSDDYTFDTFLAVDRFFLGFTAYTGNRRGWYRQFCQDKPTYDDITKLLIKP